MSAVVDDHATSATAESAMFVLNMLGAGAPAPVARQLELGSMRFVLSDELLPVRRPTSYRTMRNFIGRLASVGDTGPREVWFESLNEFNHLRELLITYQPANLITQPFRIDWTLPGGRRSHTPDILIDTVDGRRCLIDVTTVHSLNRPEVMAVFAMTAATAQLLGWQYELRTELPRQRVMNVSAIWACRRVPQVVSEVWLDRLEGVDLPLELGELATALAVGPTGRVAVLHLIAECRLSVDLDAPITDRTIVTAHTPSCAVAPWIVGL